ncbi:MAG: (deoxy)nucleoside triphosphate pyrophosphohydrolase [Cephaloticoccus sp.]|nr:(deoxy)nucleoside triphosphate pyrophosphohydrolase [Cephaloticoccus sp.]MCF7760958.1 (deoxy)nucleoside triphosphate pyrophosphohydrolase [Cephaloticoccus sp.]
MAENSNHPPIPVVCVLIERDGRVLLAQRPPHKHLGGKWEFPGGKVETSESTEAAIVREIWEELGCLLILTEALPRFTHAYAETIEMIPFVGHLAPDSPGPTAHEHVALQWLLPTDIAAVDLAAADYPVLAAYRELRNV